MNDTSSFRLIVNPLTRPVILTRPGCWVALSLGFFAALLSDASAGTPPDKQTTLPSSIDLRPSFSGFGLKQRQQGARGTCSVFTMAGALEFAVARSEGRSEFLSVDFLNWAANQHRRPADGGFFSDMWKGFSEHGICTEKQMPYATSFDPARKPDDSAITNAKARLSLGLAHHWIKEWNVKTGLSAEEFLEIKRTLKGGWPVCGGFRWPKKPQWKDDVLQMCPAEDVFDGHSVLLVGYRDDSSQDGGGALIFRNSNHGGADGFMPYVYAQAYMNDALWIDAPSNPPAPPTQSHADALPSLFQGPLGSLATAPSGRNHRISSNDPSDWHNANFDMTMLPPGKVFELPTLHGPGIITHMWFTSHAGRVNELNALSLRIYWDDRKDPGVEAPLGEFFAVGQGKPAVVESIPVQVSPSGALSCYWRMPFSKSARIVISNDNPDRTAGLYWQVDWTQLDELPPDTAYFHAQYRQEYPAHFGSDYLIADLSGRGQYVGTVLSVTLAQDGWWGEGDDFFYIDGETVPSLQGTGSEDYFNDAWGFRQRTGHWFGQPRWQGDNAGDSGVAYRWHALDPVTFTNSLKVAIEHKGNRAEDIEGFYIERPDFLNSVAFWYQTGEPKRFARMPSSYDDRRVPWRQENLVRSFRKAKSTGSARPDVQFSGMFGARPVLAWPNHKSGARLTIPFNVETAGRYALRLTAGAAPDFGLADIELDGKVSPHEPAVREWELA